VPPAVGLVSWVHNPWHTLSVPVILPGNGFTVNIAVV